MPYQFTTDEDRQQMLEAIGAASIDELFASVPAELRFSGDLDLPPEMGELELTRHMTALAGRNQHAGQKVCFLGGGSYDHFLPAAVDALASRGEFFTSYTPYQPEVAQGNLQAMFEYQTLICRLTGMDVSNASLYDGGSAAAEAMLMCMSATRRMGKVVVPDTLHPEYRQILETYVSNFETEVVTLEGSGGVAAVESVAEAVDDQTACVVLQSPNFFGCVEDVQAISNVLREAGAMLVVVCDPISLGLLKRPGDMGADIVVAEGQSLGSPMQYGGPYLGIMACRDKFVRRLPGRIAGQTTDRNGKRCWVLTLQTREQHIRREKATSNICTNQGLFALRASIYLSLLGPQGLRETAELCLRKSRYAAGRIAALDRFELAFSAPTFKEFVVRDKAGQVDELLAEASTNGIFAGIALGTWYPELADCFLVAVTEKRTKDEIDQLCQCLSSSPSEAVV
jgi:glycine dehydrogenase subunit 1